MIRPNISRLGRNPFPGLRCAFTLVELLVVMAIMLVLAGLIIGVAGNAQYKSSFARAQSEITAMSTAMESYKVDNGTYPRDGQNGVNGVTDNLNAQTTTDSATYKDASKYLFKVLSGTTTAGTTPTKAYITFLPGQLSTGNATPTADNTYLIDPWGLSYGYSTAYQATQEKIATGTATAADLGTAGYNPTFDLWSTGSYGTGGKSYPADIKNANKQYTLWAKNW